MKSVAVLGVDMTQEVRPGRGEVTTALALADKEEEEDLPEVRLLSISRPLDEIVSLAREFRSRQDDLEKQQIATGDAIDRSILERLQAELASAKVEADGAKDLAAQTRYETMPARNTADKAKNTADETKVKCLTCKCWSVGFARG